MDEQATKTHLYELAKRLGIAGRSRMDRGELLDAIRKANHSATRPART